MAIRPSERNRIGQEPIEPNLLLILDRSAPDSHHHCHRCIDLLIRPGFGLVEVAASQPCLAETPISRRFAITTKAEPSAVTARLDDGILFGPTCERKGSLSMRTRFFYQRRNSSILQAARAACAGQ